MNLERKLRQKIDQSIHKLHSVVMSTIPVHHPIIPFLGLIPGGLRPGLMIRVKGVVNHNGHRFSINLQTGCVIRPRDDVAIQLSVRPSEHCIVRNHLLNGVWGTEERYGGQPLHPGQLFDILILIEATCFKIAINNVHFCVFQHRVPFSRIQFVHVEGDVNIHHINLEGDNYQPPVQPPPFVPVHHHPHHSPVRPPYPGAIHVMPVPTPPPPPPPYSTHPPGHYSGPTAATAYGGAPPTWKKKKSNKALKAAAAVGGIGLGAFALSRIIAGGGDDDGDDDGGDDDGGD